MKSRSERFISFITELENLSVKHGVTVVSTGGVVIFDEPLTRVVYNDDPTSGDLDINLIRTERNITLMP